MAETKQLAPISALNRSLAPTYRAAAGDEGLAWSQEKAFFEALVRKHWQIEKAVQNQVGQTIESLKLAVRESASMGLTMSPTMQHVYFIPRRARKRWQNETKSDYERNVPWVVNAHPSYRGLSHIATHYAGAEMIAAEVVYQADRFAFYGPMKMPDHVATLDASERTEQKAIGVYAVAVMASGRVRAEYVDAPTIQKIRACSEFPNGLMWTKLWTEGWRKAAIRRICKTVMNGNGRMQVAIAALDRNDGILLENDVPRETSEQPAKGMAGLSDAIKGAQAHQDAASEPIELDPMQADLLEPDQSFTDAQASADEIFGPAKDTDQPALSLEWWAQRFKSERTLEGLARLVDEIVARQCDQGSDGDTLRDMYAQRRAQIRAGQ